MCDQERVCLMRSQVTGGGFWRGKSGIAMFAGWGALRTGVRRMHGAERASDPRKGLLREHHKWNLSLGCGPRCSGWLAWNSWQRLGSRMSWGRNPTLFRWAISVPLYKVFRLIISAPGVEDGFYQLCGLVHNVKWAGGLVGRTFVASCPGMTGFNRETWKIGAMLQCLGKSNL